MNAGVTASTLIDCIASIPRAGANRPSACITKLENANSAPAQPAAECRHQGECEQKPLHPAQVIVARCRSG